MEVDTGEKETGKESEEARALEAKVGGISESSAEGTGDDGDEDGKDDEDGKGCGGDNDNDGDSGESHPLLRLQRGPPPSYRERYGQRRERRERR